jgi:AraC-like DNA-binding protein
MLSPLFRTLPEVVVERADDASIGVPLTGTVTDLVQRMDMIGPGSEAMLSRTMELLFVEILRRYVGRLPAGSKGLLGALADPIAARALKLIHAEPARRWTTDSLAREAGSSRTALGERFNALVGKPPIEYLIGWRIQLAADRLRNSRESIARIAADIGYESEAAFSRAFKRVTGMTPGIWRDGGADSPPHMPIHFKQPLGPSPA